MSTRLCFHPPTNGLKSRTLLPPIATRRADERLRPIATRRADERLRLHVGHPSNPPSLRLYVGHLPGFDCMSTPLSTVSSATVWTRGGCARLLLYITRKMAVHRRYHHFHPGFERGFFYFTVFPFIVLEAAHVMPQQASRTFMASSSKTPAYTGFGPRVGKRKGELIARNTHVETARQLRSDQVVDVRTHADGVTYKRIKLADPPNLPLVLESNSRPKKKPQVDQTKLRQTQTAKLTAEFEEQMAYLSRKILTVNEADPAMGQPCPCGRKELKDIVDNGAVIQVEKQALCEVQCHNCTLYAASCKLCFAEAHRTNPFHWAEVWDHQAGFLRRHNLTALGYPLELGHMGTVCKNRLASVPFVVTAETGVQRLDISFCGEVIQGEDGLGDRLAQLLNARLFPCTFKDIESAITFNALKTVAAMDYCGSLRRLTDNAFTASVPGAALMIFQDMYENFLRCSHWWGVLTTRIRSGQEHGIDKLLVHRPMGNTVLYCPSCPEPDFNMDPKLPIQLPPELRHLKQQRSTLDGNFHCTMSTKNSDPKSYSLYKGSGFFPTDAILKEQLAKAPATVEKSTCNYLKAVNNQDKKKFKNMEITGIVNVQCSHVFVQASVDLQFGERYANVDLALAIAIRQKLSECHRGEVTFSFVDDDDDIDDDDIDDDALPPMALTAFKKNENLRDLVPIVKKLRWAVPALHIQGHQEDCMYKFATSYMMATGHFHGETAEHYWPELNQIGTQVTQMNGGRRQDVITLNHNDWNFKKMAKSFALLLAQLRKADVAFEKHHTNFLGLSATHASRIIRENWLGRSRKPDLKNRKYVKSVYRHAQTKVPTQLAIYENMLADESAIPNGFAPRNKVAAFFKRGDSYTSGALEKLVAQKSTHFTQALQKEVETLQDTIQNSIAEWRKLQKSLTPAVEARLNQLAARPIHKEMLGLPSDFSAEDRLALNLSAFEKEEGDLREGAVEDALMSVKLVVQTLVALRDRKRKHDSGVYKNTISQKQINDTERRRDLHIARYNVAAKALIRLGRAREEEFPVLTVADTALKSRSLRRQLGDSALNRRSSLGTGCNLGWFALGRSGHSTDVEDLGRRVVAASRGGQRTAVALGSAVKPRVSGSRTKKPHRKEGWLWTFKVGKMDQEELRRWMDEGDTIQWFRAEAEMERWREQVEILLADWRTTIRSFAMYRETWTRLAEMQNPEDIGHIAYAKQKADMFSKRESEGRLLLPAHQTLGPKYGAIVEDDLDLVDFVMQRRSRHQEMLDAVLEAAKKEEANKQLAETEADEEESSEEDDQEHAWATDDEDDGDGDENPDTRLRLNMLSQALVTAGGDDDYGGGRYTRRLGPSA
ncbi:hypothetical protein B0H14DRAFT_2650538 [Mycena olivaceomarginata]|nr:hypothetical protein B0H14DRAFT_2650538 [Mycena olivaceomarginata]